MCIFSIFIIQNLHTYVIIQENQKQNLMHSSKRTVQKIKFHAFKHTFSFKSKIHIQSKVSCIQTCIFIQIKNSYLIKVSCIHKFILQKEQKNKFHVIKHAFSFKLKIHIQSKFSCIHKCILPKRTKSNFKHSNMPFHLENSQNFINIGI